MKLTPLQYPLSAVRDPLVPTAWLYLDALTIFAKLTGPIVTEDVLSEDVLFSVRIPIKLALKDACSQIRQDRQ